MVKKILIGLAVIVVILVIVISLRPAEMVVKRTATIAAPPEAVFTQVNDMQKWQTWSPWAKLDPNCKITFEGPVAGNGAKFSWAGNSEVGEGSMTIVESKPNELIRFKLAFVKPMEGTCDTLFTFTPDGTGTKATWQMTAQNGFLGKAMSLFIDCDKMMGDQFEQGFTNLKGVLAAPAAPAPAKP